MDLEKLKKMAYIDKIYGTKKQYLQLMKFFEDNMEDYKEFTKLSKVSKYTYNNFDDMNPRKLIPFVNKFVIADVWLYLRCDFPWVIKRLNCMYNIDGKLDKYEMLKCLQNSKQKEFLDSFHEYKEKEEELLRIKKLINTEMKL
jgi:hypothetical protein